MSILAHPIMAKPKSHYDVTDLEVLSGIVADMRTQAGFLVKCLLRNQQIDRDLWLSLRDLADTLLTTSEELLCVECLAQQKVKLGRGQGLDAVLCDDHMPWRVQ